VPRSRSTHQKAPWSSTPSAEPRRRLETSAAGESFEVFGDSGVVTGEERASHRRHPTRAPIIRRTNCGESGLSGGDEWSHLVAEAVELVQFVRNRPDVDALHTCLGELSQLLGEQFRRSDRETLAEHVSGPVHGG
jgi:hypothetical protein